MPSPFLRVTEQPVRQPGPSHVVPATPPCQQGVSSVLMRMEQRRRRLGGATQNDVAAESPPSKCPLDSTIPRSRTVLQPVLQSLIKSTCCTFSYACIFYLFISTCTESFHFVISALRCSLQHVVHFYTLLCYICLC